MIDFCEIEEEALGVAAVLVKGALLLALLLFLARFLLLR